MAKFNFKTKTILVLECQKEQKKYLRNPNTNSHNRILFLKQAADQNICWKYEPMIQL